MSSQKKRNDFKKLALMGLAGGVLLASQALEANEMSTGVDAKSEALYAASACSGKSGCPGRKSSMPGDLADNMEYSTPAGRPQNSSNWNAPNPQNGSYRGTAPQPYNSRSYQSSNYSETYEGQPSGFSRSQPYYTEQSAPIQGHGCPGVSNAPSSSYGSSYRTYDRPQSTNQGYYVETRNSNQNLNRSNPDYGMQAQPYGGQPSNFSQPYNTDIQPSDSNQPYNGQGGANRNFGRYPGNSQY